MWYFPEPRNYLETGSERFKRITRFLIERNPHRTHIGPIFHSSVVLSRLENGFHTHVISISSIKVCGRFLRQDFVQSFWKVWKLWCVCWFRNGSESLCRRWDRVLKFSPKDYAFSSNQIKDTFRKGVFLFLWYIDVHKNISLCKMFCFFIN